MDKQHIIEEMIRTTKENNGISLGRRKFENETGIKCCDWYGKYWPKWGDAIKEAGFVPNKMRAAYDENLLIEKFVSVIREIKKFPSQGDLMLKANNVKDFPDPNTFNRLGTTIKRASKILNYCENKTDYKDITEICHKYIESFTNKGSVHLKETNSGIGYVYLMKSGGYYKLGRSINVERRNYEIGIKLPEKFEIIHKIKTDDPSGIEAYWHTRFKDKRKQGEWFDLLNIDIKAFKRRKFM